MADMATQPPRGEYQVQFTATASCEEKDAVIHYGIFHGGILDLGSLREHKIENAARKSLLCTQAGILLDGSEFVTVQYYITSDSPLGEEVFIYPRNLLISEVHTY